MALVLRLRSLLFRIALIALALFRAEPSPRAILPVTSTLMWGRG